MNVWIILIEMAVFAALFTVIVFLASRGDRKYTPASIHNYPPDIQEAYFKTHERVDVSYKSKSVILTKSFGILLFTGILWVCSLVAGARTFWQGFALTFGLMAWIGIYDPILIFAWYAVVPDKPPLSEVQQEVYQCMMGSFNSLGKVFNLNRKTDNRLAAAIFRKANDTRLEESRRFPDSFHVGGFDYDRENGVIRYSFTRCPNAEFARRHHLEAVLPLMCNCDHLAMQKLHATLIRKGTCCTADRCDYCIVGDKHPISAEYELQTAENGLWISVKKANGRKA